MMRVVSTFQENRDTWSVSEKYLQSLAGRDLCPLSETGLREGQLQIALNLGMDRGEKPRDTFPEVRLFKQFLDVDI